MRTDLTAAFIAAKNSKHRKPRQLLVFHFAAGTRYLSDQEISLGGVTYEPLVEDWGELVSVGASDPFGDDLTSETLQQSITIWNGGEHPFSDVFLTEDPENIQVDLYQWFDGLDDTDKALIDRFVIQDPIEFDEASRLLRLDLISVGLRYDRAIGDILTREAWPHAKAQDVGKPIDLIVGSPGQVRTLCARSAPETHLNGSIIATTTNIRVRDDLDALGFLASGKISIDGEIIIYDSRSTDTIHATYRGVDGTVARDHADGASVVQHITDHTYIIGQGPIQSISDVRIHGVPAQAGWFAVYPGSDPAKIVFNRKPAWADYTNSRQGNVYFDNVGSDNTAIQPHWAYWKEYRAYGAVLDAGHRTLSLVQTDEIDNHGEISKIYLNVTHWATRNFSNAQVRVIVDGIGDIGALSRPNDADVLDFEGEIDIDHPHDHSYGATHTHTFINPGVGTVDNEHSHSASGTESESTYQPTNMSFPQTESIYNGTTTIDPSWSTVDFTNAYYAEVYVVAYVNGADLELMHGMTSLRYWRNEDISSVYEHVPCPIGGNIYFRVHGRGVVGGYATIYQADYIVKRNATVLSSRSNVSAYISTSGANYPTGGDAIKAKDDVVPLVTSNRQLEILRNELSTKQVTDQYDVTDHLSSVDWSWFAGRKVQLVYNNNSEPSGLSIVVTYMVFEVEYRERQEVISDDITADVVGSMPTAPADLIKHLLVQVAGLPESSVDQSSITACNARHNTLGYRMDGVLSGDMTVREAILSICRQARCRLIWSGGLAKVVFRERFADWSYVRHLQPDDIRMRSITAARTPVAKLINQIDLFYGRDWTSDADDREAFTQSVRVQNDGSISRHGLRVSRNMFAMDLVTTDNHANDLAQFYLEQYANPATMYTIEAYLDQFDLEKEDHVLVTSAGFNRMNKMPGVIRALDRQFGSGKARRINIIRLLLEVLRYIVITKDLEDAVHVMDQLEIMFGLHLSFEDAVHVMDVLQTAFARSFADSISVDDQISVHRDIVQKATDTATVSMSLVTDFDVVISDEVRASEDLMVSRLIGFGGGEFGRIPFGGKTQFGVDNPDDVFCWDRHSVSSFDARIGEDQVTCDDNLVCSDGFGSKSLGAGFGKVPFGG